MCTVIDVPDERTEGERAFNSVMEFMQANPDLHAEPNNTNDCYMNVEDTTEDLVTNKRIKFETDEMGLTQDFWRAR